MKLMRVYLKNIAQIYIGMGLNELDISFDNEKQFNLIAGSNGSGKTSFENALNPCKQEIIKAGKKGEKILVFSHKKETFIVRHVYIPNSKGHTCKMFLTKVTKDGIKTELNPNGTINSFNELASLHLGVTNESMSLMHLGNDMINLVKMTPAERKKYISTFTKNADIFLSIYKKINVDFNIVNKAMKNYASKLETLGKIDLVNSALEETEYNLKLVESKYENTTFRIRQNQEKMNKLFDTEKLIRFNDIKNQYETNKKIMSNLISQFGNIITESADDLIKRKVLLEKDLEICLNTCKISEDKIRISKSKLIKIEDEIDNVESKLDLLEVSDENVDIEKELIKIEKEIDKYSNVYNKYHEKFKGYSIENLIQIDNYFTSQSNAIESIISDMELHDLEEFDYKKDYNNSYINILSNISIIDNKISQIEEEISNINTIMNGFTCNEIKCPLMKKFFSNGTDTDLLQQEIDHYRKEHERLEGIKHTLFNLNKLSTIVNNIINYCNTMDKGIIKYLKIDTKCECINNTNSILLDRESYNKVLDIINIINNTNLLVSRRDYLNVLKTKLDSARDYRRLLDNFTKEKNMLKDERSKAESDLDKADIRINELTKGLENLKYLIENKSRFDCNDTIIKEYETLLADKNKYDKLSNELVLLQNDLQKIVSAKTILTKDRDKLMYKKKQIKEIKKKKKVFEEAYKDLEVIRKATSTNKGIPLIYVTNFLNNTRLIANKMLEKVYDGNVKFGKFSINDKEFKMPLIKRGETNSDVRNASSGERCIAALAISLAIVEQTKTKFNILILDEMDAPLDKESKRHFLDILEKTIKKLKIKQVFLISHSGIFEEYPLNLILFKGADVTTRGDKSILFQY